MSDWDGSPISGSRTDRCSFGSFTSSAPTPVQMSGADEVDSRRRNSQEDIIMHWGRSAEQSAAAAMDQDFDDLEEEDGLVRGRQTRASLQEAGGHVSEFLRSIKGLSGRRGAQLDEFLFAHRFDMIPPPKTGRGAVSESEWSLPPFSLLPRQRDLHDLLSKGLVPGGHQSIAHVLWPEAVPWPDRPLSERAGDDHVESHTPEPGFSTVAAAADSETETQHDHGQQQRDHGTGQKSITAHGAQAKKTSAAKGGAYRESVANSASPNQTNRMEVMPETGEDSLSTNSLNLVSTSREQDNPLELKIRGQIVRTTLRGKPVKDLRATVIDPTHLVVSDDAKMLLARQQRQRLEREQKLEHYHERRIAERIQALEVSTKSEMEHYTAMQRQDHKRKERKEELKKELAESWAQKLEQERTEAELEKKRLEEKAEQEREFQGYREKQKERLEQWHSNRSDDSGYTSTDRAKAKREEMQAKAVQHALAEKDRSAKHSLKQVEVQARILRMQEAVEERPPLPPKPHDLPKPVLQMLDDAAAKTAGTSIHEKSKVARRPDQAKSVSRSYGLSPRELTTVENTLTRKVQGPGRMASYEKSSAASAATGVRLTLGERAPEGAASARARAASAPESQVERR
mmetsp:Transcript_16767/g.29807  ORF Transcript_16767/g.29807 Transcript_16767/m.29807 type:complete len:628 (-) Transcript_16767:249-2132(-)